MSLNPCNRKHARSKVEIKKKASLALSQEIITQIHYLHTVVAKNTEWSGILIYEVLEGDVNDPENFKVHAHKLIPMDVGTSGYTEYEYDPSDDSFDEICNAMEAGYKLGHIHTHHSMGTFFSGTDMSELYDNAPNHNFYLSLIVDYKNHEDWCAKIAFEGEEITTRSFTQEGYLKRRGEMKRTYKFKGHAGAQEIETVEDYDKDEDFTEVKEDIDETREVLYIIDMDISLDEQAAKWEERVVDLNKNRGRTFTHTYTGPGFGTTRNFGSNIGGGLGKKPNGGSNATVGRSTSAEKDIHGYPELGGGDYWGDPQFSIEFDDLENDTTLTSEGITSGNRKPLLFTPDEVTDWLISILTIDPFCSEDLSDAIVRFNKDVGDKSEVEEQIWRDQVDELAEIWAGHDFFLGGATQEDMHCIAYVCFDLLEPYKKLSGFEVIEDFLDQYILPDNIVSDARVKELTGIELTTEV